MDNGKYFKNYYSVNKPRFVERYNDNKQKKIESLPKEYYLNKLIEIGFVTKKQLELKTYKEVCNKEGYAFK